MAYIEKRIHPSGKVTYRARIRIEGAPHKQKSFPTKGEAVKWSRRMEAEINGGMHFKREESKRRTFAELADCYIEKELPKNPDSYGKQKMIMTWWRKELGSYYLSHIDSGMISELREKLLTQTTRRKKLRTPSTTNRYLAALSKSFKYCVRNLNWLKESPMSEVSWLKENKPRKEYLEKDQIPLLLEECKKSKSPHLYPVVLFLIATGARKGEILGLKHHNLSLTKATATFEDTKNGETRTVHLSNELIDCLRVECGKRVTFSEYVFPSSDGKSPACIRSSWENVIEKLGFKDICLHSLRHTTASHLAMAGTPLLEIQKILGHKSSAITSRVYCHMSTESTAKSLDRLSEDLLSEHIG